MFGQFRRISSAKVTDPRPRSKSNPQYRGNCVDISSGAAQQEILPRNLKTAEAVAKFNHWESCFRGRWTRVRNWRPLEPTNKATRKRRKLDLLRMLRLFALRTTIWTCELRTCVVGFITPLEGTSSWRILLWIDEALCRNGPEKHRFGN